MSIYLWNKDLNQDARNRRKSEPLPLVIYIEKSEPKNMNRYEYESGKKESEVSELTETKYANHYIDENY